MKRKALIYGMLIALLILLTACGKQQTDQLDEAVTPPEVDTKETLSPEPDPEPDLEPEPLIPFTDVPEDASYYDMVVWAYENGIVSDGSTFEPDSACTRAQVVMFLWRSMGSPEPQTAENPFSDISSSAWYYKPVLWAYENNIVTATTFNPDNACTNGETLTFLWRAEGKPAAAVYNSTVALSASDAYYARPVAWAENNGMFDGMDSAFDPSAPCLRSDIVTYLYWAMEQWTFTEEDRTVQAEYEQIANSERPAETLGSGLLYADYLDIDGDGKVELLTLIRDFNENEFTATIYANIEGHAGKSCEETFDETFWGRSADFSLCKADGHLFFQYCGYGTTGDAYQFYKIEKEAVTLENDLVGNDKQYNEDDTVTYNEHTDFGKVITVDEFNSILQTHTDKKELFSRSYSNIGVSDRGIAPSPVEYWEANRDQIYADVLNGDFSYFAGTYDIYYQRANYSITLDKNGVISGGYYYYNTDQKPISITVTGDGVVHCVIEPETEYTTEYFGETLIFESYEVYDIYPVGVHCIYDEPDVYGIDSDKIRIMYIQCGGSAGEEVDPYYKVY